MSDLRKFGSTSNIIRFMLKHATTGQGLTGLTYQSANLVISLIRDNDSSVYNYSSTNILDIATLGTFADPTTGKCRFKEVSSTYMPGLYEFQFLDAYFSLPQTKRLIIGAKGATNLLDTFYEIQLVQFDPYSSTDLGLTSIEDIHNVSLGKWVLNPSANTLTLYKVDGITVLKTFTLTPTTGTVSAYIGRT